MVDLADGSAERSVRLGADLEAARLQDRERRDRGSVESDADTDHPPVSVFNHEPDPMTGCRVGAQRCRRADPCDAGGEAESAGEERKREGETNETNQHPDHSRLTPPASVGR